MSKKSKQKKLRQRQATGQNLQQSGQPHLEHMPAYELTESDPTVTRVAAAAKSEPVAASEIEAPGTQEAEEKPAFKETAAEKELKDQQISPVEPEEKASDEQVATEVAAPAAYEKPAQPSAAPEAAIQVFDEKPIEPTRAPETADAEEKPEKVQPAATAQQVLETGNQQKMLALPTAPEVTDALPRNDAPAATSSGSEKALAIPAGSKAAASSNAASKKPRVWPRKNVRLAAALCLLLLLIGTAGWAYKGSADQRASAANTRLITEVSRLAVLPQNESPAISTVVDETKLNQDFLANAQRGDQVLLYFKAGRAVVYRPSTKQIVNMGPLSEPSPRVFVRNGSPKEIPQEFLDQIRQLQDYVFVSRDVSAYRTYKRTIVIDATGNRPDVANRLAKQLGVSVGTLPEGESRPDADVLVIVGSDAR